MASRPEFETDIAVQESEPRLKEPSKYAVYLLNDDYTTMEFVIEVLERFFQKTREEAVHVTLKVHHEGRGVAGIYSYEIAEMKASQTNDYARASGHPLKCVVEAV